MNNFSWRRNELKEIITDFTMAKTNEERNLAIEKYDDSKHTNAVNRSFPNPLYKYIRFDENNYWEKYFEGELFLQQPEYWNDLSDSLCTYTEASEYSEHDELIRTAFRRNQYATCFSETYTNMPMWYHYSDKYTGMVIAYDFTDLRIPQNLFPIVYDDYIKINVDTLKLYINDNYIKCPPFPMLVKSKQWEYEQEWRLLGGREIRNGIEGPVSLLWEYEQEWRLLGGREIRNGIEGPVSLLNESKSAIKAVYFGINTNISDIQLVLSLIDKNFTTLSIPKLYKMSMNNTKNELEAHELNKDIFSTV